MTTSKQTDKQNGSEANALKEIFNAERFRQIATEITQIYPDFNAARFLELSLPELEPLTLMQRMRRMSESLQATLPPAYPEALAILYPLAPRIHHGFVAIVLPDYVALYGQHDFDRSMEALRYFTTFGSSEFAVREFLRRDLARTLAVMEQWSRDENEHVRRLASEGCRPRLPWSFRLDALILDPSPVAPILENLKEDTSLYVRKSVANHLNDIAKDHPEWVLERVAVWPLANPHTAWIVKRALRTLIKKGDPRALVMVDAGEKAQVRINELSIEPREVILGGSMTLSFELESTAAQPQRLVADYIVHYVKKTGRSRAKVFKLKELTLDPGSSVKISRSLTVRDLTTRVHYSGRHKIEIVVNGEVMARDYFDLTR
jgi:3-methyladenine DNA glycosylase AlkC